MLALILALALPTQMGPETLQPTTYASPSGAWSLSVDPSSKHGDGKSQVAVTHDRAQAWKAELPFTFWEALITDAGYAAGYGFTEGAPGMSSRGEFVVAIFAPDGTLRLEERERITGSRFLHGPSNPNPLGIFAQPLLDRFVVRVADPDVNEQDESWWSYSLSTGEKLGREHPKHSLEDSTGLRWSMDARAVPDTPLTLVQWYCYERRTRADEDLGTRFVLVDGDWKPVWTLDLSQDFRNPDEETERRQLDELRGKSGILAANAPRRFEVRHVAEKLRVTYEVSADPAAQRGWTVREAARAPYEGAKVEAKELPVLALRKLSSVPLQVDMPKVAAPIRDIAAFGFDTAGNVRFVRREKDGAHTLVGLDERGSVVREVRVDPLAPDMEGMRQWSALRPDRWLFTVSPFGGGERSRAWFVEGASGAAREVDDFPGASVEQVAAAQDGGFVVLGTFHSEFTMTDALMAFSADGELRWMARGGFDHENEAALFSPEDVALDADGSVLVLDNIRNWIQVFGASGEHVGVLDLEALWGEQQRYLTDLVVEPSGSWLVHDFHGTPTWHRIDREGKVLKSFVAKRESGSTDVGSSESVCVDAAGRLWGTDRNELYVIDDAGVARTRFGVPPDPRQLQELAGVFFDGGGRVALVDERSKAVHLFSPSGARELVLAPAATDFDEPTADVEAVVAAPDGRGFVQVSAYEDRYLAFAADGTRSGWTELGGERVAFLPGGERWAASCSEYEASFVRKLGPDGSERTTVTRRPSNAFFTEILGAGCAPDGSLAVLTPGAEGLELDLYAASGAPQRTVALHGAPRNWWSKVSCSRRWVVVSCYAKEALLISLPDGQASLVRVTEGADGTTCAFSLSADGAELWCATLEPPALHRFALPE